MHRRITQNLGWVLGTALISYLLIISALGALTGQWLSRCVANPPPDGTEIRCACARSKTCGWRRQTSGRTISGCAPRRRHGLGGRAARDAEDIAGRPFAGPAGELLDKALSRAGIDRRQTYVTNAVKHFNWSETRGKKRIHKKPNAPQPPVVEFRPPCVPVDPLVCTGPQRTPDCASAGVGAAFAASASRTAEARAAAATAIRLRAVGLIGLGCCVRVY